MTLTGPNGRRRSAFLVAAAASALFAPSLAAQAIGDGHWSIRLHPNGLLVQPPDGGVEARYGPPVRFEHGTLEWFGVSYDTPSGHVAAVGEGLARDYARRTPLQPVSSTFHADRATTLVRLGPLEVEHVFRFCPHTRCLVIGVTLRNTGPTQMRNVMYSREWRRDGLAGGTFPPEWDAALPRQPGDVWRMAWMPNNLQPGAEQNAAFSVVPPGFDRIGPAADDVPLRRWVHPNWPDGVEFGWTHGISFADYDHDGWIDVIDAQDEVIWRNLAGQDWALQVDLLPLMGDLFRYGAAIADYDDDTLPDIADEPRRSTSPAGCVFFLHSLGGDAFEEVASDPAIVDVRPCNADCETNSVADVDGDGDLDWFFPVYPSWLGSSGNWFLRNDGPDAGGVYRFTELSGPAGLDNPSGVNRPEGAGFADVDFDGDVDLYSNNTIYRNLSALGSPLFEPMTEDASGVVFSSVLDEGGGFLDYDMDGDLDLCLAFCDFNRGIRMFENLGDGTFAIQPKGLFDAWDQGLCLGLSYEDWDNDGDVDVTSLNLFRRNQWIETGTRHFTVATESIPQWEHNAATPAWGDWDLDGDLDCALGNFGEKGRFYENYLHDAATPAAAKRHLRVRVVRDSPRFDEGLETEFGAQVTITPFDHPTDTHKRSKVVSTSAGYLNQNEYVLHFGMPVDPDPDPAKDVRFRVAVDFKGIPAQGTHRVDRHTNPVLGDLDLAQLEQREIVVWRSGRVRIDGCDFLPAAPIEPLVTVNEGLVLAGVDTPIPAPVPAPGADWFVGLEVDTAAATAPLRVEELIVDGKLATAVDCGGVAANVLVWDVTDPAAPSLAAGGLRSYAIKPRNDRNYYPIDATLEPGRVYRIAARVQSIRATPFAGPRADGGLVTLGGLSFADADPCSGAAIAAAALDPTAIHLSLRFRGEPAGAWVDLGHALAGTGGPPALAMSGDLRPGSLATADVSAALPGAPLFLAAGLVPACIPFAGGVLVPSPDVVLAGLFADAAGCASWSECVADDVEPGESFFVQVLVLDPGAPEGFAFTNAMGGTTPR